MPSVTWRKILDELEQSVSRPNFATWLKNTELLEDGGGIIVIGTPNHYAKNWIEQHSLKVIKELLAKSYPDFIDVKLVVNELKTKKPMDELPLLQPTRETKAEDEIEEPAAAYPNPFNPHYTFENFIVGNNNRLAFAASQVVSDKPGQAYNPLFIYGGVGLGKTHLMQAIGNTILQHSPKKKIIYTSCETFTSEFIQALQTKTVNEFKKKYRGVDVFLVDDIQFLANKEGTQEEFFHTFNALHQSNRQIVITSDRVPKEIPQLEDRLTSRFGWGMIADIQSPNFETRVAILQSKAQEQNYQIPSDVLEFIANTITTNVRELEGSLRKLAIAADIEKVTIDREFAARVLKDLLQNTTTNVSTKKVIQTVARYFDLETADLLGKKRIKELVYPRQIIMYILRENLHQSFPQIGDALGGKDHTTVMHGVNKIIESRKTYPEVEQDLKNINHLFVAN